MTDAPDSVPPARTAAEAALAGDGSPTGAATRWAVGLLTAPGPPSEESMAARLVPAFLAKHPQGFSAVLKSWRAQGPFELRSYEPVAHKSWTVLSDPSGARHTLSVTVDTNGLVRIVNLQPEVVVPEVRDWAGLEEALHTPGVDHAVLAARLEPGRTVVLHRSGADRPMPSGSVYKLYVLRALLHAVERGELRWDDEVTVRPELRSLPTGDTQDLPDGTRLPVREAAYRMIATSDNTATDLIADRLGRDAVERGAAGSGHHDPSLLRPFLTSRELFEIGWGDPELRTAWAGRDETGRRELLRRIRRPMTVRVSDLGETRHRSGLDWHMSAFDVLRVLRALRDDSARDSTGTVEHILTANPGLTVDRGKWPRVYFKGGACPGVAMFCWLLEDRTGTPHVLVLRQIADEQKPIGDAQFLRGLGARVIASGLLESDQSDQSGQSDQNGENDKDAVR
ncbi:serine hydrolase [Streptomyces sp. SID2888]|uniref:serine hydrolase n=1 Tax=Streptomyces sp. SID2888 TaxID=2690256 RepID=UPI00136B7F84|nr:serine hydrolase [Streptomyces sp. SID2888]MYV47380.1 serine hydrolase [Streptomyces sp. SID2888]